MADDVRSVLERSLMTCCTLTENQWVEVEHEGTQYNLKVQELQPAPQVSILDTDIEADVGPSMETEEQLRRREEEIQRCAVLLWLLCFMRFLVLAALFHALVF